MISIVILTKDEEGNIRRCIRSSADLSDDIHVLDSGSTDRTVELARGDGAHVWNHPFKSFGEQRNWAIDNIATRYLWTLHLDADEELTPEIRNEIRELVARDPTEAGFFVPSKMMLAGQWLRYSSGYPVYQVRLFHRNRLRFIDHGHGQREVTQGTLGKLHSPYLHWAFSHGLDHWLKKHVDYARREAAAAEGSEDSLGRLVSQLLQRDPVGRRRAIKALSYRLPSRPTLRWLHLVVLKRGILDGRAGLTYARMMATYEAMIDLLRECPAVSADVVQQRTAADRLASVS